MRAVNRRTDLSQFRDRGGEGRGDHRVGASRGRFARAVQGQMRSKPGEELGGHAEHAAEFIHSLEWRARRTVIQPRRAVIPKQRLLGPRGWR